VVLEQFSGFTISGLTLPLFVSIPVVYVLATNHSHKLSRVTKWLLASLLLVLVDILLLGYLYYFIANGMANGEIVW